MAKRNERKASRAVGLVKNDLRTFRQMIINVFQENERDNEKEILHIIMSAPVLRSKFYKSFQSMDLTTFGAGSLYYNQLINEEAVIERSIAIIDICNEQINRFLILRDEYEKYLTYCVYDDAIKTLDIIEKELGISVWGIGQRLLLTKISNNHQENELWRQYITKLTGRNTVLFLLDHLRMLVDFDISYSKYLIELDKHLGVANTDAKRYLGSKLKIDRFPDLSNIPLVLQIDFQISIIDFFLSYESYLLSKGEYIFHEVDIEKVRTLLPQKITNSSVINNIRIIIGEEPYNINDSKIEAYKTFDLYAKGDYGSSGEACKKYLEIVPNDFQTACILCKSYIYQNKGIEDGSVPDYIKWIYSLYCLDENFDKSALMLQIEMRKLYGIGMSIKIRSFLGRKNIIDCTSQFRMASFLLDEILSPNCLRQIENERLRLVEKYFEEKSNEAFDSIVGIINGNSEQCSISVDPMRKCMARIQCFCNTMCLNDASEDLDNLHKLVLGKNLYFYERYLQLKLLYYKKSNMYLEAVHLLVDIYFENRKIYNRILNKKLFFLDYRTKDVKTIKDINHMILTYLIYPTETSKQIIVYNNLLDSNGIESIEDYLENDIVKDQNKWLFFYKEICKIELLKKDDRVFVSSDSPEQKRIKILSLLVNRYHDESCYSEIYEIRKIQSIQDKIKTIKHGRINVDTEKILELNNDDWKETFQKWLTIRKQDKEFYYIDYFSIDNDLQLFIDRQDKKLVFRNSSKEEQLKHVMSDLVSTISNELLFNPQYGLETYLSTRIRHGYCKGQLMSFLQNLDLIAVFDQNSENYSISKFWKIQCGNNESEIEAVREMIVFLTGKIEEKIADVLANWLRVKISSVQQGMFDYTTLYSDDVIRTYLVIMETHADFNNLYNEIVNTFWDITDKNLLEIQKQIDKDLKEYYIQTFDEIIDRIPDSFRYSNSRYEGFRELYNRCQKAKADSVLAMQQFKDAFVHSHTVYQDFTLEELSQCTQRTIHQLYDAENIQWIVNADDKIVINGLYFLPFVDIMCILIDNAIRHSGIQEKKNMHISMDMKVLSREDINPEAIKRERSFQNCDNYISIAIKNNVNTRLDMSTIERKLKHVFQRLRSDETARSDAHKEGGTGIAKLVNIIEYQINWLYFTEYSVDQHKHEVTICCIIGADKLTKG